MKARRSALFCLAAFCLPVGGSATTEVAVQAGKTVQSVDNPFLLPATSTDPRRRSDTITSTDIGVAMRMPLPSDRSFLAIGAAASRQQYDVLNQLDHTQRQIDAQYQWEYSSLLRGRVRHRFDERLYNYYGGFFTQPETPRATQDVVELALRITPELDLPVTYTQGSLRYGDAGLAERYNQNDRGLQLALSYTSGRQSTLRVGVRQTDVRFPNRNAADLATIDSGFTDREAFVDVAWRYTDNTVLSGRIGTLDRTFDSLANRNTQLLALSAGVDWRYSPKTALSLRGYRQPQSSSQSDVRLYVISTGLQARLLYDLTAKTRITLNSSYEQQKYQSLANTQNPSATGGNDRVTRVGARLEYAPTQRMLLLGELAREHYEPDPATSTLGEFSRKRLLLGLSYTFENMQGANRARTLLDTMKYDRIQ